MQIRYVEFGKRFIPYGSSDFIVLSSSDREIEKNVDYFRRAVLQFPKSTIFNDRIGNVSLALVRFPEGFLFVQVQSRREDEVKIDEIEPTMHRPFTQIRFSYLSSENLIQLFSSDIGVYTSLLYNNPANNQKHLPFRLADYGWFDRNGNPLEGKNEWKNRVSVEDELTKYSFHTYVEKLVNLINKRLQTHKDNKKGIALYLTKDFNKKFTENFDLYYRLALLQTAQLSLYPRYGLITFAFDYITEQETTLKFYTEDMAQKEGFAFPPLTDVDQFVENYYESVNRVKKFVFEPKLRTYFSEAPNNLSNVINLYRLIKREINLNEKDIISLIRNHFRLLTSSEINEHGFPEDLYSTITLLSFDTIQKWIVYEDNAEIINYLFDYLKLSPSHFITAYIGTPKNKVNQIREAQFGEAILKIQPLDLQMLKDDKAWSFWVDALNLSMNKKDLKFKSGESIILALMNQLDSSTSPLVKKVLSDGVRKHNAIFIQAMLNEVNNPTKKNLLILLQLALIFPDVSVNELDKDTASSYRLLYNGILNRVLKTDFVNQFDISMRNKWSALIRKLVQEVNADILALMTDAREYSEEQSENFIIVSSLTAGEDIIFADWFFFHVARYALKHRAPFKKIYQSLHEQYPESKIKKIKAAEKNYDHSSFFYLISLGVWPQNLSLYTSLRKYYGDVYDVSSLYYLLLETWVKDSWCIDKAKIVQDDIAQVIIDLDANNTSTDADRYNQLLIIFAKQHTNQCRLLNADSAKIWLKAALKSRSDLKTQEITNFYTSYTAYDDKNKRTNYLFNALKELIHPDSEFLWEISGTQEAVTGSLEACQVYISYWNNKLSAVSSHENMYQITKNYFDCAALGFSGDSGENEGELLSILRKLMEVKYENITYSCRSQRDAYFLLLIYEFASDPTVKTLSKQFLEKYLSHNEDIQEKIIFGILNSDIPLNSSLMRNYISVLISDGRFESQVNIMGEKAAVKMYEYATSISARAPYINVLERRLHHLNPSITLQSRPTSQGPGSAQAKTNIVPGESAEIKPPALEIKSNVSKTESGNESQSNKGNKAQSGGDNPSKNESPKKASPPIVTIEINKYSLVIFALLLAALIILNIALLWQYYFTIPNLLKLMGAS